MYPLPHFTSTTRFLNALYATACMRSLNVASLHFHNGLYAYGCTECLSVDLVIFPKLRCLTNFAGVRARVFMCVHLSLNST